MKVENNGVNRYAHSEVEGSANIDKLSRYSDINGSGDPFAGKDKATLSEKARLLAKARGNLDEIEDMRSEKVDQLRQQIDSGNYQIPHEQIIKKLLSQVRMG